MAVPALQLDIEKVYQNEYWTNRYLLDGALGDAAVTTARETIIAAERAVTYSGVLFTRTRLGTLLPGDDQYSIGQLNLPGLRSQGAAKLFPLFNVIRVDFSTGFGRPSRKYLRGCLLGAEVDGPSVAAGTITLVTNNFVTPLVNEQVYVDPQGDNITAGSVSALVGMRQLRRGAKRRSTPVL